MAKWRMLAFTRLCLTILIWSLEPVHAINPTYLDLAAGMIESNVGRSQGLVPTNKSSTYIEQAIFQQSLRAAIKTSQNESQKAKWQEYLTESTNALAPLLSNATKNAHLPLDRFSAGTSLILEYSRTRNHAILPAIEALQKSALLQQRNHNAGLWYYDLTTNLAGYRNLSYLDGMYSYPAFAALSDSAEPQPGNGWVHDALLQLDILQRVCVQGSGLLVHGYDALKAHSWANPVTGASPIVWGRALAWYTVGLITMYEQDTFEATRSTIRRIFQSVITPQIEAYEHSLKITNAPGVWQVVDRPGDSQNFIEASASFLTSFALLAAVRLGIVSSPICENASRAGRDLYKYASQAFLIKDANGTLSVDGTSSVASLGSGGNISYEYYVTRPTELNSLFGTSAFTLASLEMARSSS